VRLRVPNPTFEPPSGGYAARPQDLQGLRVGFLDGWGERVGDAMDMYPTMRSIRRLLEERYGVRSSWRMKANISQAVTADELAEVVREVDVVVNGEGLCGSCTAASILDAIHLEALGVPTVTIVQDRFEPAAKIHARIGGLPDLPLFVEPALLDNANVGRGLEGWVDEHLGGLIAALTADTAPVGAPAANGAGDGTADVDDFWAWDALARERGWTDGLTIAPPTRDRVDAIIDALGGQADAVVGRVAPAYGVATIEQIAVQCVMAGCRPEHAPVVVAAVEAMVQTPFNLHGVQCTTNPVAPLVVVSGPIVDELDFNVGAGVFSGGGTANLAIGRAVRLILWNLGGAKPGLNDMAPIGHPAKLSFCVAENRARTPWPELHTDFGYSPEDDVVTVFGCHGPYGATAVGTPERMLRSLCEGFASTSVNMYNAAGQYMVVLSVKPAEKLAAAGYSKEDVRDFFFEHARLSAAHLRRYEEAQDPGSSFWGEAGLASVRPDLEHLPDDECPPFVRSRDDIHIIVTGGDTQWWAGYLPGFGSFGGLAVTSRIRRGVATSGRR
jgi:hypothetical protein